MISVQRCDGHVSSVSAQFRGVNSAFVVGKVGWQNRPHDGLRNPYLPGQALSPNESYAVAVARAGYLPVALSTEDYIELLPAVWRTVNDYGIRIDYRTYDSSQLNPYRRQPSGVKAKQNQWEIHYDPYDVSRIWLREAHTRQWVEVPWTHLPMIRVPFADFTWRHALQILADQARDDTNETAVAGVLKQLLRKAGALAQTDSAHVVARTRAGIHAAHRPVIPPAVSQPATTSEDTVNNDQHEPLVPFGVFNPQDDEKPLW